MRLLKLRVFILLSFLLNMSVHSVFAQDEIFSKLRLAIKSGDANAISTYLDDNLDLKIENQEGTYSGTQAEFVLKDYFRKYPPLDFKYLHKGESPGGAKYAIGSYLYNGGTYRVYMKLKKVGSRYRIDTLDFTKDKD